MILIETGSFLRTSRKMKLYIYKARLINVINMYPFNSLPLLARKYHSGWVDGCLATSHASSKGRKWSTTVILTRFLLFHITLVSRFHLLKKRSLILIPTLAILERNLNFFNKARYIDLFPPKTTLISNINSIESFRNLDENQNQNPKSITILHFTIIFFYHI